MKLRSLRFLLVEGLKNIWAHRLMSIASVGVLVACMLMMGVAIALSFNIDMMLGKIEDQNVIMVFYKDGISEEEALTATEKIANIANVKTAEFISKEEGLERQKEDMGSDYAPLLNWLEGENPLPDGAQVTLNDLEQFDATIESIRQVDGVDSIEEQRAIAQKLSALRSIVNNAGFWIIALLVIISLVIVANTIKVTMYARKLEISIMKAVGATNGFIRLPFVIEGVTIGIGAGVISIGLLYFIYKAAIKAFEATFGAIAVPFSSFVWPLFGAFVLMGALVGAFGSIVSIGKYLRREGSEFNAIM